MKRRLIPKLSTLGKPEIRIIFKYINNTYAQKTDGKFLILGIMDQKITCGSWFFINNEEMIQILQKEVNK